MLQREIHIVKEERYAKDSRLRLFGRRLLDTFSRHSRELCSLRKLMYKLNEDPSKSSIEEIRELGGTFRSLTPRERTLALELEVFYCFSRVGICSADPILRGVAETECRITDWRIREGILQTFLNTS